MLQGSQMTQYARQRVQAAENMKSYICNNHYRHIASEPTLPGNVLIFMIKKHAFQEEWLKKLYGKYVHSFKQLFTYIW